MKIKNNDRSFVLFLAFPVDLTCSARDDGSIVTEIVSWERSASDVME